MQQLIFKSIDGLSIPFNKEWNSIAISVSGGADSALLAYLLCTFGPANVHVISHVRMWKSRPWQQHNSLKIYNYLVDNFPHINFKRHINFIAPELEYGSNGPTIIDEYGKLVSGDNLEQRAFAEYVCSTEDATAYYNAVTRNPKIIDLGGMKERDVDSTIENSHLLLMEHMGRYACHPFRFTDKSWVVKQYKRLGIEELFHITRSCEGEFIGINFNTYTPGQHVPICNKCFWCKEREWAIEQNK